MPHTKLHSDSVHGGYRYTNNTRLLLGYVKRIIVTITTLLTFTFGRYLINYCFCGYNLAISETLNMIIQ